MTEIPTADRVDEAIRLFKRIDRTHHRVFEKYVGSIGVSRSQHMILMQLSHADTPPKQHELASRFEVSPAAMTVMLKKMEADGLVTRTASANDSRSNDIVITDKGSEITSKTHEWFEDTDMAMFSGFSANELNMMITCLKKMQINLDRLLNESDADRKGR